MNRRKVWQVTLSLLVISFLARVALATIHVDVGDHVLNYNGLTTVDLYVTGLPTDIAAGLDLAMTVNNGVGPAPIIVAVDVSSPGTVFGDAPAGNSGTLFFPAPDNVPGLHPWAVTVTNSTDPDHIPAPYIPMNGLLAHVTFSTVGLVGNGPWTWSLSNHQFGPTDFGADTSFETIYGVYTDGQLTVVPEPGSVVLGLLAAASLCVVATKKRRGTR